MKKHLFFSLIYILSVLLFVSCSKDDDKEEGETQAEIAASLAGIYNGKYTLALTIKNTLTGTDLLSPDRTESRAASVTATVNSSNADTLDTEFSLMDVDVLGAYVPALMDDTYTIMGLVSQFGKTNDKVTSYTLENSSTMFYTEKIGVQNKFSLKEIATTQVSDLNVTLEGEVEIPEQQAKALFPGFASLITSDITIVLSIVLSDMTKDEDSDDNDDDDNDDNDDDNDDNDDDNDDNDDDNDDNTSAVDALKGNYSGEYALSITVKNTEHDISVNTNGGGNFTVAVDSDDSGNLKIDIPFGSIDTNRLDLVLGYTLSKFKKTDNNVTSYRLEKATAAFTVRESSEEIVFDDDRFSKKSITSISNLNATFAVTIKVTGGHIKKIFSNRFGVDTIRDTDALDIEISLELSEMTKSE